MQVFTYNGKDWGEEDHATQGGYSDTYTIDSKYVYPLLRRPKKSLLASTDRRLMRRAADIGSACP